MHAAQVTHEPTNRAMRDFDVLLINVLDVLAGGDKKYAVQFMNKFNAAYATYPDIRRRSLEAVDAAAAVEAYLADSFVVTHAAAEPFFTTVYPFFDRFQALYAYTVEMVLLHPVHAAMESPAYQRAWAAHERLVAFMESILYAVSSRRTRALLVGLSGLPTGLAPALAITTAK